MRETKPFVWNVIIVFLGIVFFSSSILLASLRSGKYDLGTEKVGVKRVRPMNYAVNVNHMALPM